MLKKLFIILLFGLFISFISFSDVYADANEARDVYLSATEYDYPPFSVTDSGEADGFSVQLLKAVAEEMGITVTFKIDQWTTLKEELRTGELDILPLVGYTIERDDIYDFTVPYIVMRGNIFIRKGYTGIQSQDDLFGKEILVLDGDNSQEWAWSIGLDEELTATQTYTEAFELLDSGQYDAVLAQGLVGELIIHDNELDNIEPVYIYENGGATRLKLNLEGYEQKFCFAVVEGDSQLLSILNEGLNIVSVNGKYDELYQTWFPFLIEQEPVSTLEILMNVGFVLVPILIILMTSYVIIVRRSIRFKTAQIEKNNYQNQIIVDAFQKEFTNSHEKYDYVLDELAILTGSETGFIFTVFDNGDIDIKTCCSNSDYKKCDHKLLDIIKENELIQKALHSKTPIVSNDYKKEFENASLNICERDVFRLIALPIRRFDEVNVVVLINKKTVFSEDNINQTSILMTGLWTMLEREEQNEKVEYISFHDALTGLYNRRFFEDEMARLDHSSSLPITIAMGDVNGLKLVNDAFGHEVGDQLIVNIGNLLKRYCGDDNIVARWGGDEFIIILPHTSMDDARILLDKIAKEAKEMNQHYGLTSIAFGIDSKIDDTKTLKEVFLTAEQLMYKDKMKMTTDVGEGSITTIMNTLFKKCTYTKKHSERVSIISAAIATKMNFSKNKIEDIKLMGMVHDIGKVIIDASILNSPNRLTVEEENIVKMHPVSGGRMLSTAQEYARLASGVLHHHERWDGNGYPNGIKADSIPIESRIISVAEAFDDMTSEKPYRKVPLTTDEAIGELIQNKGTQFDPDIVDLFVSSVRDIV